MPTIGLTRSVPTAVAAAAIGLGALMTVGAPYAHASAKTDCEGKGGTYTETSVFDHATGKTGTTQRCCVKDTATNTTSCTSSTVTQASRTPLDIPSGAITAAENLEPIRPAHRIPVDVLTTDSQILATP